ncbi:MAG: hypothetical protein IJW32_05260 [Clostridia bacterium]|nr:hypothetical protein [Clostridia bacterium]
MVLYLSVIVMAAFLICGLNLVFNPMIAGFSPWWIICVVVIGIIIEIAIDGIFAAIIHAMPNKWFDKDKKFFDVSRKERKFYDKLKIKNWKDKVAELGALGGFRKNKLNDPKNPDYLALFVIENNKGIVIHVVGIIAGFLILLFPLPKYALVVGLPIALVNVFLNLLSTMVLRYNIPRLKVSYERAVKQLELEKKQQETVKNVKEETEKKEDK